MAAAVMAVAVKVAAMAAAVKLINQLKTDPLELKAGKIVVMGMLLKMLMALIKVVVEGEEVLRLKVETTLLRTTVEQNLKNFFYTVNAQHLQVVGQFYSKLKCRLSVFDIFHSILVSIILHLVYFLSDLKYVLKFAKDAHQYLNVFEQKV